MDGMVEETAQTLPSSLREKAESAVVWHTFFQDGAVPDWLQCPLCRALLELIDVDRVMR